MDIDNKKEIVSVNATLAEWLHLIDLIDLACVDLNNKMLSEKLHKLSSDTLGTVTPLGTSKKDKSTKSMFRIIYNGDPVPEKGEIWFSKEDSNFAYIYTYYLGNVYYFYIDDGNTCAMYKISIQDFMESFTRDKNSVNLLSKFRSI